MYGFFETAILDALTLNANTVYCGIAPYDNCGYVDSVYWTLQMNPELEEIRSHGLTPENLAKIEHVVFFNDDDTCEYIASCLLLLPNLRSVKFYFGHVDTTVINKLCKIFPGVSITC